MLGTFPPEILQMIATHLPLRSINNLKLSDKTVSGRLPTIPSIQFHAYMQTMEDTDIELLYPRIRYFPELYLDLLPTGLDDDKYHILALSKHYKLLSRVFEKSYGFITTKKRAEVYHLIFRDLADFIWSALGEETVYDVSTQNPNYRNYEIAGSATLESDMSAKTLEFGVEVMIEETADFDVPLNWTGSVDHTMAGLKSSDLVLCSNMSHSQDDGSGITLPGITEPVSQPGHGYNPIHDLSKTDSAFAQNPSLVGAAIEAMMLQIKDTEVDIHVTHTLSTPQAADEEEIFASHVLEMTPFDLLCALGCVDHVTSMLSDPRIAASITNHSMCLVAAARNGSVDVVRQLLLDSRVDPSLDDQMALQEACRWGHTDVVQLLLGDARVDPSAGDYEALVLAGQFGHDAVESVLMADPRMSGIQV